MVADSTLTVGETSLVTFTFWEAVSGFTNADLTARTAADGGVLVGWRCHLDGVADPGGDLTDSTNLIRLADASVFDPAGNARSGAAASNNYAVDTARPTVVADCGRGHGVDIGETRW